jgi:2-polyprenyl-3-methyl-5-hydroxy-6-metoxy-1,4-benzoquinol methylase/tetratricopeptide (TPR) repeat protein
LGHPGAKPALGAGGKAAPEGLLGDLFGAALARHRAGAFAEAGLAYRHILTLFPAHAETNRMLGAALMAQAKAMEAIPYFERAIELRPDHLAAYEDLGRAQAAVGNLKLAISVAARALEIGETPQNKAFFAQCVRAARFTADDGRMRKLLQRAVSEAWDRPRELTAVCIGLIKLNGAVKDGIARALGAWPERLSPEALFGATGVTALAQDRLLCCLLETDPMTDVGLERLLTDLRCALLAAAAGEPESGAPDEGLLGFYCALARQCFINGYVYAITADENEAVRRLQSRLEQALADGAPYPPLWPVAVGAYVPLQTIAQTEKLLDRSWPQAVASLLVQQVKEPAEERRLAAMLPVITTVDTEVSRAVRQQYEENPYPRWVTPGPPGPPLVLDERQPQTNVDVLIAGCGTGLSTIEFARQTPRARITAVDLSVASLSYAQRMAQKFGVKNVTFGQADILKLGSSGRAFDYIDASGVLHHLADPWAGWRVLLALLRSEGVMQVGLYSALARRNVNAARALIAERGYRPMPDDIRRFREEVMSAKDGSVLKSMVQWNDFFAMNECRDLAFHVQEHQISLPEIKTFLAAEHMQFVGFALDAATQARFAARFPEPAAMTDLDRWHEFETAAPETFAAMYQFFIRKPRSPGAPANPG